MSQDIETHVIHRERVTPEIAREWLKLNTSNRTIRRRHVESLAREMKDGRWKFNYETIKFGASGRLLNGQHRLAAVILSGETVDFAVIRGVPDDVYVTLDQGARRKAADDLQALGITNTYAVSAAARIILMWDKALPTKSSGISKTEVVEFVTENPEIADYVSLVNSRRGAALFVPVSAVAALGWMVSHAKGYDKKFEEFLDGLATGAGLGKDSPVLTLRNYGINLRRGHSLSGVGWFGLVVTAWNDFINSRARKIFRPENQNWPSEVVGYPQKRLAKDVRSAFTYIGPKAQAKEQAVEESEQPEAATAS